MNTFKSLKEICTMFDKERDQDNRRNLIEILEQQLTEMFSNKNYIVRESRVRRTDYFGINFSLCDIYSTDKTYCTIHFCFDKCNNDRVVVSIGSFSLDTLY